jgi:hypothetical protein
MVARQPALFGLARMFEIHRDAMGLQLQVVHSIDEAYDLLKVTPEDFSQRLFPVDVAARSGAISTRSMTINETSIMPTSSGVAETVPVGEVGGAIPPEANPGAVSAQPA